MNDLHTITALRRTGAANSPQSQAASPASQDLLGFMSELLQLTQATPGAGATATPSQTSSSPLQISSANLKDLTAKIADILKKDGSTLPASLQNMTPQDLTAKIAAPDANAVKPPPVSDLITQLSAQIQTATGIPQADTAQKITAILTEKTGAPQADLTALLNKIQPANPDNTAIAQVLVHLQAQQQPLDPAILQQLKDQVTQFLQNNNAPGANDIAQLKATIVQSLKDQGMAPPAIGHYLTALAKLLKQGDTPASDATATKTADPLAAVTAVLMAHSQSAPVPKAVQPQQAAANIPQAAAPAPEAKGIKAPQQPDHAPPSLAQKDAPPPPPSLPGNTPVTPSAPQQQAPQQTLSEKIAGFGVSPGIVSALANSDDSLSSGGFGTGGNGQSSGMTTGGAPVMQPATVDTLNNQNFTNYLTAAKDAPSATTQMVNLQLQRNIAAKIDTMTILLTPADLGRMDIKLKFAKDGSVKAHMTVDKPETLAMLQKDSHHLEKILQQSGLDADENSLSFDLRQQNQQQNLNGYQGNNKGNADGFSAGMDGLPVENALQAKIALQANGYITQSGVNIMV